MWADTRRSGHLLTTGRPLRITSRGPHEGNMADDEATTSAERRGATSGTMLSVPLSVFMSVASLATGGGIGTAVTSASMATKLDAIEKRLGEVADRTRELERSIASDGVDRWRRQDHENYARETREEIRRLDERVRTLESQKVRQQ